jgi:hypothetical protein
MTVMTDRKTTHVPGLGEREEPSVDQPLHGPRKPGLKPLLLTLALLVTLGVLYVLGAVYLT